MGLPRAVLCAAACLSALWYKTTQTHKHIYICFCLTLTGWCWPRSPTPLRPAQLPIQPGGVHRDTVLHCRHPSQDFIGQTDNKHSCMTVCATSVWHSEPWYCSAWEPLVRRACNKSQNSLWGLAKVTVSCRQKRSQERQIAQKVNIEPHLTSLLEPLLHSECYYVNNKNTWWLDYPHLA